MESVSEHNRQPCCEHQRAVSRVLATKKNKVAAAASSNMPVSGQAIVAEL